MNEVLLTSETFVKSVSNISDNIAGKYLLSAIREAQEIKLKSIVGSALLSKLKQLVADNEIAQPENAAYQELIDRCQYFLTYQSIAAITIKVSFKVANIGVSKNTDENVQYASLDEVGKVETYYQSKADFYAYELQLFLLDNASSYPELSDNDCYKIRKNLYSSATCGVWLGGPRGKIVR